MMIHIEYIINPTKKNAMKLELHPKLSDPKKHPRPLFVSIFPKRLIGHQICLP